MPARIIGRIQGAGDGRLIRTARGVTLEITAHDLAQAIVNAETPADPSARRPRPPKGETPR